jgi:hypothetical protein
MSPRDYMRRRLELLGFDPAQIESYISRHEQAYKRGALIVGKPKGHDWAGAYPGRLASLEALRRTQCSQG